MPTGRDLKALRTKAGLTANFLRTELGVSLQTWSRYENDKIPIPKAVWIATRYLCLPKGAAVTAADRLVEALLAVIEEKKK